MSYTYNCELRYSLDDDFTMKRIIHVVDTIASIKMLLMKLAGTSKTAIAFIEIDGKTMFTLSYWSFNSTFHASHFNGLEIRAYSMRDFSRERAKNEYKRKRERKIIGAEKFANMRK